MFARRCSRDAPRWRVVRPPLYCRVDYIIALVVIVVLVPLIIFVVSRRGGSGAAPSKDHGVTPSEPASDEPTPRPGPGVDPHIPPS